MRGLTLIAYGQFEKRLTQFLLMNNQSLKEKQNSLFRVDQKLTYMRCYNKLEVL